LSLVSVDSTTARAHHDAAGLPVDAEVLEALEKAAAGKRADTKNETGKPTRQAKNAGG
jgi:hypothetical protein